MTEHSEPATFRRAATAAAVGLIAVAISIAAGRRPASGAEIIAEGSASGKPETAAAASQPPPPAPTASDPPLAPTVELPTLGDVVPGYGLTDPDRACLPPDPIGLGPYAAYRKLDIGRVLIPQKGGHTDDLGFDVIIHFHGHEAARKSLVQTARGVVFAGIEHGILSGHYAKPFSSRSRFKAVVGSIEDALKAHTEDKRAHIRHLALSGWSAGYGAINQILKRTKRAIDAVILLDGLHAGWRPKFDPKHEKARPMDVDPAFIKPVFDYATRAARGEGLFVFTHSEVDPVTYASTSLVAGRLLSDLDLKPRAAPDGNHPHSLASQTDVKGLHVWGFRGGNKAGHCAQLQHISPAVSVLEKVWGTPAMDRTVKPTPAPPKPSKKDSPPGIAFGYVPPEESSGGVAPGDPFEAVAPPIVDSLEPMVPLGD